MHDIRMDPFQFDEHSSQQYQQFPLTSVDSFRIPLRRKNVPSTTQTMYEQSLDLDTFHAYLNQHTDPNESRFYDDFFTLATSQDWKTTKRLPGLPTPPATPDKTRFQFEAQHMPNFHHQNNNNQQQQQQQHMQHQQKIHTNRSPASGLQVVPDSIDDHQQNDYLPWFQDSNKFFNDQHKQQQQQQQQQQQLHQQQQIQQQNDIATSIASSPIDRNQSPHVPVARNGQQYPGYELADARCNATHLNLATIPDCILSPVSPRKRTYPFNNTYNNNENNNYANNNSNNYANNNNNNYANPSSNNYANSTMMSSPNHIMSPIPNHFNNTDIILNNASMRTSEENYYRQLAYEKFRSQHKLEEVESPTLEQELSLATHNVLERQRRNDLKLRFNILRDNIPELANNDKAPKIQILKKALEHLAELKSQEQKQLVDVELEKQRKIILVNRLKSLQLSF